LVQSAKTHPKNNRHLINVNFPGGTKPFAGIKRCIPSKQTRYKDEIVTFKSPVGKEYVWIKGELCENNDSQLLTDISAIRAGYVSVSAINVLPEDSGIEITF
jgi:broad specificity polyphosphatase/5'/3'-nucleotidase SurE